MKIRAATDTTLNRTNCSAEKSRAETQQRNTHVVVPRLHCRKLPHYKLNSWLQVLVHQIRRLSLWISTGLEGKEKRTWGEMFQKNQRHGGSSASRFQLLTLFGFSTRKHSGFTVGPGLPRGGVGNTHTRSLDLMQRSGIKDFWRFSRGYSAEIWDVSCLDKPGSAVTELTSGS